MIICMHGYNMIEIQIYYPRYIKSVHGKNDPPIYHPMRLVMIIAAAVMVNYSPRTYI